MIHLYRDSDDSTGPCFTINFPEHREAVALPVKKVIETAFNALKSSSTEPGFYRKQCWEVIKSYLVASLQLDEERGTLLKLLTHPMFREGQINPILGPQYRCSDKQARSVHQMAVTGMFVAAAIKELRQAVLPTMVNLVRHYTMVAISQQAGPFPMNTKQRDLKGNIGCTVWKFHDFSVTLKQPFLAISRTLNFVNLVKLKWATAIGAKDLKQSKKLSRAFSLQKCKNSQKSKFIASYM